MITCYIFLNKDFKKHNYIKNMMNIVIVIELILIILVVGKITLNYSQWLFNSKHDGFAGNFIGGIIGGIIAFGIAKYQISKQNSIEKQKKMKRMRMEFTALKNELKYNDSFIQLVVDKIRNNTQKIGLRNCPISDFVWDSMKLDDNILDELNESVYNQISDLYLELKILKNPDDGFYDINSINSINNKINKCIDIIETKVGNFYEK
jgi:hypothetical protein